VARPGSNVVVVVVVVVFVVVVVVCQLTDRQC